MTSPTPLPTDCDALIAHMRARLPAVQQAAQSFAMPTPRDLTVSVIVDTTVPYYRLVVAWAGMTWATGARNLTALLHDLSTELTLTYVTAAWNPTAFCAAAYLTETPRKDP